MKKKTRLDHRVQNEYRKLHKPPYTYEQFNSKPEDLGSFKSQDF